MQPDKAKETSLARYVAGVVLAVTLMAISLMAFASLFVSTSQFVINNAVWIFAVLFWAAIMPTVWCTRRTPVSKKQLQEQTLEAKKATTQAYRMAPQMKLSTLAVGYDKGRQPWYGDSWKNWILYREWWRKEHDRFVTHINEYHLKWDSPELYYPPD